MFKRIEVDVPAAADQRLVIFQWSREESVSKEMALSGLAELRVNPPGIAAVQLAQSLREATSRQADDEVVMVLHQNPRRRHPVVLARHSLVHAKETLVFGRRVEER